jgi:MYXO-CTERM domain-containing protein
VAPQGAALSVIDTGDAPDDVGLSAVDLTLSQLNGGEAEGTTKDQAIYVSTPGALALRGLTTPGGLGSLALLTAIEAEVTLHDVSVVNEAITQSSSFAAVQQSVISLTRPASVDLQRARICGFVAQGETTGALDMVTIDAPAGDVLLEQSALWGAASFGALVRVIPDDSGLSDAEVILRHNSLIGGIKDFQDGATIFAGSVVATGNLLSRLDVGLVLSGQDGETETYNLFSETVSTPRRDEGGQTVRIDDTSTDDVAPLDLVPAFKETSCAALPELLESSPAVNGGDPTGTPDPDGSIPDQGALPITLDDTDGDGSFDVDDCAPDDPTIGDTLDEVYGDGLDNDCDPSTIDDDEDGDGLSRDVDCDDADPTLCPPVTQFFGGRAACGCAAATATPGAPWPLWLAPLAGIILRRRRRQAP